MRQRFSARLPWRFRLLSVRRCRQISVSPRAKQLHDRAIVVDSHDDTTQRLIFGGNILRVMEAAEKVKGS